MYKSIVAVLLLIAAVSYALPQCDSKTGYYPKKVYEQDANICPGKCIKRIGKYGGGRIVERTYYKCCPGYKNEKAYPNNIYNNKRKCVPDVDTTTKVPTIVPSSTRPSTESTTDPVVQPSVPALEVSVANTDGRQTAVPVSTPSSPTSSIPKCSSLRHFVKAQFINTPESDLCLEKCKRCKSKYGNSYDCVTIDRYVCCDGLKNVKAYPNNPYNNSRKCIKE